MDLSELHEVASEIDHHAADHLIRAFDIMAERAHANQATALWAIAILAAKVFAAAPTPDILADAGLRLSKMLKVAYPAVVRAVEAAQRQADGRRPYDA